ncbi:MAG: TetR/AcrR family transcriptional regulator [Clostridia bacterium]|nr:TetR/AcrR family transcriptional regulator [Clostridia bacterium]
MPPKVKFQKEEIVRAAMDVAKERGIDAVTAREVAKKLGVSTRPIFTYFDTMEQLKAEVFLLAKRRYREYVEEGLKSETPFFGVGQQYIRFARQEAELYKLLFLTKPSQASGGAVDAFEFSKELVRPSVMRIYNMDAFQADRYYRNLWLVVFSFCTLIVTGECPYTDEEMFSVLSEVSLSLCKAYKEIPGLAEGRYDKDRLFRELTRK